MSLLNKLGESKYSLLGNKLDPQPRSAAWGFADAANTVNPLDPKESKLQNTYDVNSTPKVRIVSFNKTAYAPYLPQESQLDELDNKAPNLEVAGVVSQIYKSKTGRNYKDLGPTEGRYFG
jgi:hypothetical protein